MSSRIIVGIVFLLAGFLKILIFTNFSESTQALVGIPEPYHVGVAVLVLLAEILAGVGLLTRIRLREARWLTTAMLGAFVIVLLNAEWMGLTASCNCFGTTSMNLSYLTQVGIDVGLLVLLGLSTFEDTSHPTD